MFALFWVFMGALATGALDPCTVACFREGLCGPGPGGCEARHDKQCKASDVCKTEGRCAARAGVCAAAKDADCAKTRACRREGRCSPRHGVCVAADAAACLRNESCGVPCGDGDVVCLAAHLDAILANVPARMRAPATPGDKEVDLLARAGVCHLDGAMCKVGGHLGCAVADECLSAGYCTWNGKECVRTSPVARAVARAAPQTDRDCAASDGCREDGTCALRDGECKPGNARDCRESARCRSLGDCTLVNGECSPGGDGDCKLSDNCRTWGNCALRDGRCRENSTADCQKDPACKAKGMACVFVDGRCGNPCGERSIDADADKPNDGMRWRHDPAWDGSPCEREGRCTPVQDGCVALGNDCRKSDVCAKFGRCTAQGGRCVRRR